MSKHSNKRGRPSLGLSPPASKRANTASSFASPVASSSTAFARRPNRISSSSSTSQDDADLPGPATVSRLVALQVRSGRASRQRGWPRADPAWCGPLGFPSSSAPRSRLTTRPRSLSRGRSATFGASSRRTLSRSLRWNGHRRAAGRSDGRVASRSSSSTSSPR
jgi:hypothetical protein